MADSEAPKEHVSEDEQRARKAAADSLRRQIERLKTREPRSLNEFIERTTAEDHEKEKKNE